MAALSAMMMLSGCETSGSTSNRVTTRSLPYPPAWAKAVSVPEPKAGENSVAVIARERAGRIQNQAKIEKFHDWYLTVRKKYE